MTTALEAAQAASEADRNERALNRRPPCPSIGASRNNSRPGR